MLGYIYQKNLLQNEAHESIRMVCLVAEKRGGQPWEDPSSIKLFSQNLVLHLSPRRIYSKAFSLAVSLSLSLAFPLARALSLALLPSLSRKGVHRS